MTITLQGWYLERLEKERGDRAAHRSIASGTASALHQIEDDKLTDRINTTRSIVRNLQKARARRD